MRTISSPLFQSKESTRNFRSFFFVTLESDSVFDLVKNGQISNTAEGKFRDRSTCQKSRPGEKKCTKKKFSLLSQVPEIDFQASCTSSHKLFSGIPPQNNSSLLALLLLVPEIDCRANCPSSHELFSENLSESWSAGTACLASPRPVLRRF